jgi:hypothetical protein
MILGVVGERNKGVVLKNWSGHEREMGVVGRVYNSVLTNSIPYYVFRRGICQAWFVNSKKVTNGKLLITVIVDRVE